MYGNDVPQINCKCGLNKKYFFSSIVNKFNYMLSMTILYIYVSTPYSCFLCPVQYTNKKSKLFLMLYYYFYYVCLLYTRRTQIVVYRINLVQT